MTGAAMTVATVGGAGRLRANGMSSPGPVRVGTGCIAGHPLGLRGKPIQAITSAAGATLTRRQMQALTCPKPGSRHAHADEPAHWHAATRGVHIYMLGDACGNMWIVAAAIDR